MPKYILVKPEQINYKKVINRKLQGISEKEAQMT